MLTVHRLKTIANAILEQIDGYDDDAEIYTFHDTKLCHGNSYLATNSGFVNYFDITLKEDKDWEEISNGKNNGKEDC